MRTFPTWASGGFQRCGGNRQREMSIGRMMSTRRWPIWLGTTGVVIAVVSIAILDARAFIAGAVPTNHTTLHGPMLWGLRNAFLLIALGVLWRLLPAVSRPWRWAVAGAAAMLACGVVVDVVGAFARADWIVDPGAHLGAIDSVEHRLFRLAAMAAYAVPMLVLLAAAEPKAGTIAEAKRILTRIAVLLLRWEPVLFTIGATTLATTLAATVFIHKELAWALPIGADTTVAGCGAAAIRAGWRGDRLAFGGWLAVLVSMGVGLLMGSYSFGGPLPTPGFIGDYDSLPRMLLRDGHIMVLSLGVVGIAAGIARTPNEGAA